MGVKIDWIKALIRIRPEPFDTGWLVIGGTLAASIYATGDAVGTPVHGKVPKRGVINTVLVLDQDKEEIRCDLSIFDSHITITPDHDAFDVVAKDMLSQIVVIPVTNADYVTYANSSYATVPNAGYQFTAPNGEITIQWVTRGAPTIAANKRLAIRFLGYSGHGGK